MAQPVYHLLVGSDGHLLSYSSELEALLGSATPLAAVRLLPPPKASTTLALGSYNFQLSWQPMSLLGGGREGYLVSAIPSLPQDFDASADELPHELHQLSEQPIGVAEISLDGQILYVNSLFARFAGFEPSEMIGHNRREYLLEKDQGQPENEFWQQLLSGHTVSGQFVRLGANGKERWVKGAYTPIVDGSGQISRILFLCYDISYEKELENSLLTANGELRISNDQLQQAVEELAQNSEELEATLETLQMLYRQLQEQKQQVEWTNNILTSVSDGLEAWMVVVSPDFHVMNYNSRWAELIRKMGMEPQQGRSVLEYLVPEIREEAQQLLTRGLSGEHFSYQREYPFPDGIHVLEHEYIPVFDKAGVVIAVCSSSRDITHLVELARKAENAANLNRTILDATSDYITVFDREYKLLAFNEAWYTYMDSQKLPPTVGQNVFDLMLEPHRVYFKDIYDRALAGEAFTIRTSYPSPDRTSTIYFDIQYTPLRNSNRDVVGVVKHSRDVTQEVQRQMDLEAALLKYQTLSRAIREGIFEMEMEAGEQYPSPSNMKVNDQYLSALGLNSQEELTAFISAWRDSLHPDDYARMAQDWVEFITNPDITEYTSEIRMLTKLGIYRWFRQITIKLAGKSNLEPLKLLGAMIDIDKDRTHQQRLRQMVTKLRQQRNELAGLNQQNEFYMKQLREVQKQLEGRLRALDNSAIVMELDSAGHIVYLNDRYSEIVGFPKEEVYAKDQEYLLSSPYHELSHFYELWETISNKKPWRGMLIKQHKEIRPVYLQTTFTPIFDLEGNILRHIGIMFDLTRQVEQQQELDRLVAELRIKEQALQLNIDALNEMTRKLEAGNRQLQTFLDEIPLGILIGNDSRTFFFANRFARTHMKVLVEHGMLATSGREIPESYVADTDDPFPLDRYPSEAALRGAYIFGEDLEVVDRGKRRRYRYHGVPVRNATGEIFALKVLEDISEEKANQRKLYELQQQLTYIVDHFPGIIYLVNRTGEVLLSRGQTLAAVDLTPAQIIGKPLDSLVPGSQYEVQQALEGRLVRGRYSYWGLVFDHYFIPIQKPDGSYDEVLCVGLNVTENVEMMNKLLEAKRSAEEASKAREVFLANVSHEIRTPLHGIIGFAELIGQEHMTGRQKGYLNRLLDSAHTLQAIMNDLLSISRFMNEGITLHSDPIETALLVERLQELFAPMARKKRLQIKFQVQPGFPDFFTGDNVRLQQVLGNLLHNAIKFTTTGGIQVKASFLADQKKLQFEVMDTGIGIPSEHVPYLFEAFSRASLFTAPKFGGTGLGLSIVRSLVEAMGGTVAVQSVVGKGTHFTIHIPYKAAEAPAPERPMVARERKSVEGARVLVAEDYPANQILVAELLKQLKVEYRIVGNGQEALEWLTKETFDALLVDLRMPILDGFGVIAEVRKYPRKYHVQQIVAASAFAGDEDRRKAYALGANRYLVKPFGLDALSETLSQIIVSREAGATGPKPSARKAKAPRTKLKGDRQFSLTSLEELFAGNADRQQMYLRHTRALAAHVLELLAQEPLNAEELLGDLHKLRPVYYQLSSDTRLDDLETRAKKQARTKAGLTQTTRQELVALCTSFLQFLDSNL